MISETVEEDVNVTLHPLDSEEGESHMIHVRIRATPADVERIAMGIQEQLPSAGVSVWRGFVWSDDWSEEQPNGA